MLSRTPADDVATVSVHLARMMAARGLKDSPLFAVPQGTVSDEGLLPASYAAEVRGWLDALAADAAARRDVVNQTVAGAVRTVTRKAFPIADAAAQQVAAVSGLLAAADQVYDDAESSLVTAGGDGTLLRGDLLARWQEFVGSGEPGPLPGGQGRLRAGAPGQRHQGQAAAGRAGRRRRRDGAGVPGRRPRRAGRRARVRRVARGGLRRGAARSDARRPDPGRARAALALRAGRPRVAGGACRSLVRTEAGDARHSARFLALGVRGLSVTLAVVALAGEDPRGQAAESVRLGRSLLDTILGEAGARRAVEQARAGLLQRLRALMGAERARYLAPAAQWELKPDAADQPAPGGATCGRPAVRRGEEGNGWTPVTQGSDTSTTGTSGTSGLGDLATRGTPVGDRVAGLTAAVTAARGRVPDPLLDEVSTAAERATGRLRLSARHTVVAIAGATGSGKSSTYNALTGLEALLRRHPPAHHLLGDRGRVGERGRR
ncbi:hypothetical protein [Nocardioides convexus]|uniref:hypothetical protein n=1 Tax=Nocardioides convexus TaxID=2712224 RepID=UPI002418B4FD|nr:hypothetical protein [Nocardioides convexus]